MAFSCTDFNKLKCYWNPRILLCPESASSRSFSFYHQNGEKCDALHQSLSNARIAWPKGHSKDRCFGMCEGKEEKKPVPLEARV